MEATAVSLARSVLEGVLRRAGSAVYDEVALVLGVPREVEFIRSELEMMQSFLKAASERPDAAARTDTVRTWVKQVRDLAYDVEDCLFDFALYSTTAASSWSLWPRGALPTRHRIAERIRDIKARVEELNQRNQRYHLFVNPPRGAPEVDVQQQLLPYHDGPSDAEHAFNEWDIIGRSKEKKDLIDQISAGDGSALALVSVWQMGGMGKSSLVSMVRNDPEVLDAYDYGAWVTVPHPLHSTDEFMQRLRKQLGLEAAAAHDDHRDLYLEDKRYMVVVDDLLTKEEWDLVWPKLFHLNNTKGSRVIVTTRRKDVALYCAGSVGEGHSHVYELKPLDETESLNLLCKKVFKEPKFTLSAEMRDQASYILKRCLGLPLAISTIGGLLANRPKKKMEWMNLHEYFGAELESNPGNIMKVIASSYDGLSYHLKSIFMYLSIFPENHEIRRTRMLRRWIAEGYIAKNRNMPVAELGERSFNELMNRSMIQPSKKKKIIPGLRVGRCTIHSILLQIILSNVLEENQLFLIENKCNEVPQSKIRHLVVSRWKTGEKLENMNLSCIRSLTIFGDCPVSLISPKLRLLRVLDLEDTSNVKNEDLRQIGELRHLRYLSLRGTGVSKLPSSLENLRYLETIDIQDTKVMQLPHGIVKLENLRYIIAGVKFSTDRQLKVVQLEMDSQNTNLLRNMAAFISCNRSKISNMVQLSVWLPKGIEKLRNLHTLGVFNVGRGNGVAQRLGQLTDLQRLGITVTRLTEKGIQELCQSIGKLVRLQKLEVRSHSLEFLGKMVGSDIPKHLVSLKLIGHLSKLPDWITWLSDLTKVKLLGTNLDEGQVNILGNLPSVAFLGLWEKSYVGKSLCFKTGEFQKLKFLDIDGLENIAMVTIEEPKLKFLEIDGLDKIQIMTIKKPELKVLDTDEPDKIEMVPIEEHAMPELEQLWVKNCTLLHNSGDGLSGVPYLVNLNELLVKQCGEKEKLIEILQWQVSQWHVGLHKKRPKFLIGKIIVPTSSRPNTSTAAGQ